MTTLPKTINPKTKQIRNVIRALKELQGSIFGLTAASSFCAQAELMDISMHLKKMAKDVHTIQDMLRSVYKKSPIDYNLKKAYDALEIVIGEK